MQYTAEQVLSLSPNTGNKTRGKKLANTAKWPSLGANEKGVWGLCQGSGSNPYKTAIDFNGPAFKCSCPSREFPCKHGIGLFLLYVNEIEAFTELDMPAWVEEWLSKRTEKKTTKKKLEKTEVDQEKAEESKQKRLQKRFSNMGAGLLNLQNWIEDIIRQGFGSLDITDSSIWSDKSKELVNAQCPGIGNRLSEIPSLLRNENWVELLLIELSEINTLIQAFKNKDTLPEALKEDVFNQLGFNTSKEDVLARQKVSDDWLVLHISTKMNDNLSERRIWLYGLKTKEFALLLDFSFVGKLFEYNLPAGQIVNTSLAFYPSAYPLRALIASEIVSKEMQQHAVYSASFQDVINEFALAKSKLPFIKEVPCLLEKLSIVKKDSEMFIHDQHGFTGSINMGTNKYLLLLSITGGNPFSAFGLYGKDGFFIKSVFYQSKLFVL